MNAFGEPITVTDDGGTITYDYYSSGLPKSITANGSTISMTYDIHGNRHTLNDPDAGLITTVYNAFGELVSQTDARGNTYTMLYDVLGRMYRRSGPYGELTTRTFENTVAGKLGTLTSVALNNGTSQSYSYDALGRITSQTETTGSESFTKTYTYDAHGRVEYENWYTGFGIRNVSYTYFWLDPKVPKDQGYIKISCFLQLGFHARYKSLQRTIRRLLLYRLILYSLKYPDGNPHFENQRNLYEASHTSQESAVRFCLRGGPKVWRAEWACVVGASNFLDFFVLFYQEKRTRKDYRNTDFADNGNIEERTDIGNYNYSGQNAGPHAVTSLSNTTGTLLPTTSQAVDYTAFNKASHITQGSKDYFITYGPDRLRTKTSLQSGIGEDILLTKYYALGDFEKETDADGTRELHYIAGGDGLAAIYVKYDTGADSLFYVMQDHLGSLVGAINAESDHVYRQSFDAWGRERNPTTWGYANLPDDFPFLRGYTGHEHLKWFGLINMNGRMYDASLCRFLSPDPYVQMPDNSQNFNRYSYCLNNPLVYTDPSGEFIVEAIILGAMINTMIQGASGNINSVGDFALAMGIGALSGAAGYGAGQLVAGAVGTIGFAGGALTGAASGFAGGFTGGAGTAWAGGANFGKGLGQGIIGGGFGAVTGGLIGGISGGITAKNHGGDFWTGDGATFCSLSNPNAQGVQGTPDNYTDDYLNEFTETNFQNADKLTENVSSITADSGPSAKFTDNGHFLMTTGSESGKTAWGYNRYLGTGKGYQVWISKAAFASNQRLYLTLGHELLHTRYGYSGLLLLSDEEHASIYKWQLEQAKKFYMAGSVRSKFNYYKNSWNPKYDAVWKELIPIRSISSFNW